MPSPLILWLDQLPAVVCVCYMGFCLARGTLNQCKTTVLHLLIGLLEPVPVCCHCSFHTCWIFMPADSGKIRLGPQQAYVLWCLSVSMAEMLDEMFWWEYKWVAIKSRQRAVRSMSWNFAFHQFWCLCFASAHLILADIYDTVLLTGRTCRDGHENTAHVIIWDYLSYLDGETGDQRHKNHVSEKDKLLKNCTKPQL